MRPNVQLTRDPLNIEALPPMGGMELDYRTGSGHTRWEQSAAIYQILFFSAVGFGVIFALRVAGLVDFLSSPLVFVVVVVLGVLLGVWSYLTRSSLPACLISLLSGPTLWALVIVTKGRTQLLLCLPAFALAVYLAHRVVMHYARWMHANPHLDRTTRADWLRIWNGLFDSGEHSRSGSRLSLPMELHERTSYLVGFGVVVVAYLIAVTLYNPSRPFTGSFAIFVFLAVLLLYALLNCALYRSGSVSVFAFPRLLFRALASWFSYGDHGTLAPGVFQSPDGDATRRARLARLSILAVALAVLPAAFYCPLVLIASPQQPWLEAASTPWAWPWQEENTPRLVGLPDPPTREQVLDRLSPAEKTYLDQLPGERHRELYLTQIAGHRHRTEIAQALAPAYASLTATPESWMLVALRGAWAGQTLFIWALLVSVVVSLVLPALLFFVLCFALGGRLLMHFHLTLEAEGASYHRPERLSPWECYQQRLRESEHETFDDSGRSIRERDHLFVGVTTAADYPVLLHRDILTEHAHFTGDTGSGKSALGIAPIVAQLIGRPNSSVVLIDLKGDMALFEAARLGAERSGVPFKWFTNRPRSATFAFNPFLQSHMKDITRPQLAQILLKSLGLEYGEGYGPAYFSSIHRDVLTKLLTEYREIDSFERLRHFLSKAKEHVDITREQRDRATHLMSVVNTLATFEALNVTPAADRPEAVLNHRIDMSEAISSPHVIYFYLHAPLQEATVREVAKLALHSLLAAAVLNKQRDHQVYLFVDEFQQIVSQDLEIVLRMARDSKIATVLANQTMSDLETRAVDLRPTVQANTRYKQVFSSTDLRQQDDLIKASGETLYLLESWTEEADGGPVGLDRKRIQEVIGPRLRRNDLIETSDAEKTSIVHVSRGRGYTQFGGHLFTMHSEFHITNDEYERRRATPWPLAQDHAGTFTPELESQATPETVAATRSPETNTRDAAPSPPARPPGPIESLLDDL
ncbi:MAG: hypothetical protein KJ749_01800 [Planctomycetes bacterium]|nr:hypothetical protein [Planctomycetota bacterium]